MAQPPARPKDAAQVAKLALLGIGTLATGAFGAVSLFAGYKYKKAHASDPAKVTVSSYLDDLTHLVPPWEGNDGTTAKETANTKSANDHRLEELQRLEAFNADEDAALRFVYDSAAFDMRTSTRTFPLAPDLLCHVCTFLPYESVCLFGGVSRGLNAFSEVLLSNRGFVFQQARSQAGLSEQLRGPIWMRISGAASLAEAMSQKASSSATVNFYHYLVRETEGYRRLLIAQNGLGNREPVPPHHLNSPSAAAAAAVDLSDLSEEARTSLDTILKDVPRTLVPSNASSGSLISNPGHNLEEDMTSLSPAARAREDLIASLSNVLSVYCVHDTELGYCQGMNFVAVYLLQKLPEQDAYWIYYKIMQDRKWGLRKFYMNGLHGLLVCKYQFHKLFELYLPELAAHFHAQDVHSDIFTEWFMTFFTFPSFPRRYSLLDRVWDLMLASGGLKFIFRAALAILFLAQTTLLELEFESIIFYLKNWPDDGITNPQLVLPLACDKFLVSNKALLELEKEFEKVEAEEQKQRDARMQVKQQAKAHSAAAAAAAAPHD